MTKKYDCEFVAELVGSATANLTIHLPDDAEQAHLDDWWQKYNDCLVMEWMCDDTGELVDNVEPDNYVYINDEESDLEPNIVLVWNADHTALEMVESEVAE